MKKFMVADLVKDARSDSINTYMKRWNISKDDLLKVDKLSKEYYNNNLDKISLSEIEYPFQIQYLMNKESLSSDEAYYLVDNWDSEAEWLDVMKTAEDLNVGIEDVEDDDVEMVMELGGVKGEIESSLGKVFYWYNIALGTYLLTTVFDKGNPAQYPVSVSELQEIRSSESFGEYFNKNIRANPEYSDKPGACGCIGDDPDKPKRLCTSEDFANMPLELREYVSRFVSIS
jgi:hypothetical protein